MTKTWRTRWDDNAQAHRVFDLRHTGTIDAAAGLVDRRRVPSPRGFRDRWFARPYLGADPLPDTFATKVAAVNALLERRCSPCQATTQPGTN